MRRSGSLLIPLTLILIYYAFWVFVLVFALKRYPGLAEYLPVGGIDDLKASDMETFEPVYTRAERALLSPASPIRLLLASVGALIVTVPISWAYFITSRARRIDQSFLQTIIILPVVVTGIAMIVVNSIALAFSLAGVVAAVRFRFTLEPALRCHVHLRCHRDWPWRRYRGREHCRRDLVYLRDCHADHLEARIRQDARRAFPDHADTPRWRRRRLLGSRRYQ